MLYAIFMYPNRGWEYDVEWAKNAGLKVGERYEVRRISMGQSSTSVFLKDINGDFNSVQFEFEEDGKPIDIYRSPKYNPYL
jgi:hypothetical protein